MNVLGVDVGGLGPDPYGEVSLFAAATTGDELDRILLSEVDAGVRRILKLSEGCDAFDVIELQRLREFPLSPELASEPGFDGSAAVIELIAVVLLSRGSRGGPLGVLPEARPHESTGELHELAKRLLRLATYHTLLATRLEGNDPLRRVAADYQMYFAEVRSHQFASIEDWHNAELFGRSDFVAVLEEALGFGWGEFVLVRDAAGDIQSSSMTTLRDRTAEIIMTVESEGRSPDDGEAKQFREDIVQLFFLPGERASFTAVEVASATGIDVSRVERILDKFSVAFDDSVDATEAAMGVLRGRSPFVRSSLISDSGVYLSTIGPIGADSFRSVAEESLKSNQKAWKRYDQRIRSGVSERLATAAVERLLGCGAFAAQFEYVAPKRQSSLQSVDRSCTDPLRHGNLVESDALFVVEDVAVCVEVKGRSVASSARRGDTSRLEREAKNILGAGAEQAGRLAALIVENGGVWGADSVWVDLSSVHEVHTIVVGLDFFGPLSVALGDLERASVLNEGRLPWITSLHDLEVISRILDQPAEFLLYLRRQTSPGIASGFRGLDELDLFMVFLNGDLYSGADQHDEALRRGDGDESSGSPTPTTVVGDHTGPLNDWVYFVEGSSGREVPKPTFNCHGFATEVVRLLERQRTPGWLRCGADFLGLAGEVHDQIVRSVDKLRAMSADDGDYHQVVFGFNGNSGYPLFFAASRPRSMKIEVAGQRLRSYVLAKQHSVGADRAFGLLFDEDGAIEAGVYSNTLIDP